MEEGAMARWHKRNCVADERKVKCVRVAHWTTGNTCFGSAQLKRTPMALQHTEKERLRVAERKLPDEKGETQKKKGYEEKSTARSDCEMKKHDESRVRATAAAT